MVNSNLKQTRTIEEQFLYISGDIHFERFGDSWDPFAPLGDICLSDCYILFAHSKTIQSICSKFYIFEVEPSKNPLLTFLLSYTMFE